MEHLRRIGTQRDILGESPVWDDRAQVLYWVDIRKPAINRHNPATGETESWQMPDLVGAIALTQGPDLLVALGTGIVRWQVGSDRLQTLAELTDPPPGHRFNDGRADREGHFWVGTMHNETRAPEGILFRLDETGLVPVLSGVSIPNSLSFSPDGKIMYFADSQRYAIESFDMTAGWPTAPRTFAETTSPAFPDGATVDAEGHLWYAEFFGSRVVRRSPDGHVSRVIDMPVDRPTSCTFGGADLQTLYITTTCQNLSDAARVAAPLAGALLAIKVDVPGLVEPRVSHLPTHI